MNYLYLKLCLSGALLFLIAVPAVKASEVKDPNWLKCIVVGLVLSAMALFFGGALGVIWTFQP